MILDDIWAIETGDCLKAAFREDDAIIRKILLTTHNKDVAMFLNNVSSMNPSALMRTKAGSFSRRK